MRHDESLTEQRWDAEYKRGRYADEEPVAMVSRIVAAAHLRSIKNGLYIGCGNGRNYMPLHAAGLELLGIDISAEAIQQLRRLLNPPRDELLFHGTLQDLPLELRFPLVIGIQVFQHGNSAQAAEHIRAAASRVEPQGLFAIRVNAVGTDIYPAHRIVEDHEDGFTVQYLTGPKHGLNVHFFSAGELNALLDSLGFSAVEGLRRVTHQRRPPEPGAWCQWEGIWELLDSPRPTASI